MRQKALTTIRLFHQHERNPPNDPRTDIKNKFSIDLRGNIRRNRSVLRQLSVFSRFVEKKKREDLCFFGRRKKTYDACFALFHFYFALENPIVQELHHISTDPLQHSRSLIMRTCVYAVPRTIVEKRARASTRVCTC